MTSNQNRVSPGVPTGGQFTTTTKPEAPLQLAAFIDPTGHLAGMDRARAQACLGLELGTEAAHCYHQLLGDAARAANPKADRVYVSKKVDPEFGVVLKCSSLGDRDGNDLNSDSFVFPDRDFDEDYLDAYTEWDEDSQELYINLNASDPTRYNGSTTFPGITGSERVKALGAASEELQSAAAELYVQHLSSKIKTEHPAAGRVLFERDIDPEEGVTFEAGAVVDAAGAPLEADAHVHTDVTFHDIHLDRHLDYDESADQLYLDLTK